jgi:phage terminase large subunit-like protein
MFWENSVCDIGPFDAKPCTDVYSHLISHKYKLINSEFEY